MEQLPTTIDNLIELPVPSDPQISPDGQWVVYTLRNVLEINSALRKINELVF